jgi:hypothetical protein
MKKPEFFTAIIKKKFRELKAGNTVFFKKFNGNILLVCDKFSKEISVKEFLETAVPILNNKSNKLYYNPRAARKAEKLYRR